MRAEAQIICVDCGGDCYLVSHDPADELEPGSFVTYRCRDCWDRWDLVLPDTDDSGDAATL